MKEYLIEHSTAQSGQKMDGTEGSFVQPLARAYRSYQWRLDAMLLAVGSFTRKLQLLAIATPSQSGDFRRFVRSEVLDQLGPPTSGAQKICRTGTCAGR